jgi:hypothetical protein
MLTQLQQMVLKQCEAQHLKQSDYRFSRKDLRHNLGWSYDQVRVHLERLVNLEYVLTHKGGRGQSFVYELLYDGENTLNPHLCGLIKPERATGSTIKIEDNKRENITTTQSLGSKNNNNGVSLGAHWVAFGEGLGSDESQAPQVLTPDLTKTDKKALIGANNITPEQSHHSVSLA